MGIQCFSGPCQNNTLELAGVLGTGPTIVASPWEAGKLVYDCSNGGGIVFGTHRDGIPVATAHTQDIYACAEVEYVDDTSGTNMPNLRNSAGALMARWVNTAGSLAAQYTDSANVIQTVTTISIVKRRKYFAEILIVDIDGVGTASVYWFLDRHLVASLVNTTLRSTTRDVATVTFGAGTGTYQMYVGNVLIADEARRLGPIQVFSALGDGAGNYTAWTGAYTDVDDDPASNPGHDTDGTYLTSATSGQAETVALPSAATIGLTTDDEIIGVKAVGIIRDEGGAAAVQMRIRSGTTDSDGASVDPGTTYVSSALLLATDPATAGAPWTAAAIDALEVGVDNAASVAARVTALQAQVAISKRIPKMRVA